MRQSFQAIILAAGKSSRFWPLNQKHKSLFKLMGRPLILELIEELKKSGLKEIIIIQSPKRDVEKELTLHQNLIGERVSGGVGRFGAGQENYLLGLKIRYIIQKKPLGTGDAVLSAEKFIKDQFFVLNAERVDLENYLKLFLEKIKKTRARAILLSAPTKTPWLFGNLKLKGDRVLDIIEKPKKKKEFSNFKNVGFYFLPKEFLNYLKKIPVHPFSLIKAIRQYAKEKELKIIKIQKEPFFLKYPWDLFDINEYFFKKIKRKIRGKFEKNCQFKGPIIIGEGTNIKSGTYIEGPVYIGKNCQIGPNCYIRAFTSIGDNCHIGQGVEVKNSIIRENSKIPHQSYVGDSIIAENCNLGAGLILANLRFDKKIVKSIVKGEFIETGRQKFGSVIGANTQMGVNSSIMPGVLIGSNCNIGPNSVIFENLEDNTNFYTEFKGIKKQGCARLTKSSGFAIIK